MEEKHRTHYRSLLRLSGLLNSENALDYLLECLQGVLRYGDFVARQGGNEFVVILRLIRNELNARKVTENMLKLSSR